MAFAVRPTQVLGSFIWLFALILIGALTAVAGQVIAFVIGGIACVIVASIISLDRIFLLLLILATVVAGSLEYFVGLGQAHWVPYLLGVLLTFRALTERMGLYHGPAKQGVNSGQRAYFLIWAILYLSVIAFSTLTNLPPFAQAFVGIKNYLFMWGVLLAFSFVHSPTDLSNRLWKAIVVIACLQFPVVLYQRFFVGAKGGAGSLSWDSVVGTFGGIPYIGGHSATMAMFITVALVIILIAWRNGSLAASRAILIAGLILTVVLLAEVKAFAIWSLLAVGLVFGRLIRSRPLTFIAGIAVTAALLTAFAFAYKTMYYDNPNSGYSSFENVYDKQIFYVFDPNKSGSASQEMGRVSSILFWWREHDMSDPAHFLVGHGIGSSRFRSSLGVGEAAKRYVFSIDTSAATTLLWDLGLLGMSAFVAMLISGAIQGFRLARNERLSPGLRTSLECAAIALVIILTSVPYNRDSVDDTSTQFLLYFCLALVGYASRLRGSSKLKRA